MALLELRGVAKRYRQGSQEVVALDGVDLDVAEGESVAVVGRSGSGKSTLLHLAGGLDQPDAGSVRLRGRDLAELSVSDRAKLRRHDVGFIFQFFHLLPTLSVAENVAVPRIINGARRRDALAAADRMLEQVELRDRRDDLPDVLSGGEQQRVAIARALVHDPDLVVCDEPTSALDHETGMKVLDLMRRMVRERGTTVLIVTHDNRIFPFADRIARMDDGRIVEIDEGANAVAKP
jgi:putative ABC transport system ATP-binding protein